MNVYVLLDEGDVAGLRPTIEQAQKLADDCAALTGQDNHWYAAGPSTYARVVWWRLVQTADGAMRRQRIELHRYTPPEEPDRGP
jgi:hypothetical protein